MQGNEEDVAVKNLHVRVGFAGMINVVCAVAAAAAVQAPAIIDCADTQLSPAAPAIGLEICNLLARVLCNLPPAFEVSNCKAALAFD